MARYPLQVFTREQALVGFDDDYKSSTLGQKFAGMPRGVYIGLTPTNVAPSPVLTLAIDAAAGFSLAKVYSFGDPGLIDIVFPQNVTIDLTSVDSSDFPVDVIVRANYVDDATVPTTAEILTRSAGTLAWYEVRLCRINGSATSMVLDVSTSTGVRTAPLAFDGVDYGFMPAGSVEALQQAVDIVNEVVAARVGLDTTTHASLSDRLSADQTASSMASRLGLALIALRSNDYTVGAGVEQVNVSGSFSEINRDHNPRVTLGGLGDETTVGAVSDPSDTVRNVCVVQDAASGYRPVNDPTERLTVFGRLTGPEEVIVRGTWTFTNASTSLLSTDGQATSDLQVGDTIQGVDGKFYEVAAVLSDTALTLQDAYTGATASSGNLIARRWLLKLRVMRAGAEAAASFAVPTTIRFVFPAFVQHAVAHADWRAIVNSPGVPVPTPVATTSIPGLVRLAAVGSLLGAVEIQNIGVPLAGGPFHTINFSAPAATLQAGPAGEIIVSEIGPIGPVGATGTSGAPGNPGPTGPGFSALNAFEESAELSTSLVGSVVPWSFTRDMGHNIRYLAGGIARYRDLGFHQTGGVNPDTVNVTNITAVSATEGRIEGDYTGDVRLIVFLSSAGD